MRIFSKICALTVFVLLGGVVIIPPSHANGTLDNVGALDVPITVSSTNQIYTATTGTHVCTVYGWGVTPDNASGTNVTVGDVFSLSSDGTQITVDTVTSDNKMSTFHISKPAYSTSVPDAGNSWANKVSVANSAATPPCMNEDSAPVLLPRQLDNIKSDVRSVKDFGATMDGSSSDKVNIQLAYDATPNGGVISIPCNSVWPVNPMDNLGDWSPTHTSGKSVIYSDTCGMTWNGAEWGGWKYMDHAIGDDDLMFQLAGASMWLRRQEFSSVDNHAPLSIGRDIAASVTYTGGGNWGGSVYAYTPSVMVTTRNGASGNDGNPTGGSIMGFKTETQTYSNQPWSVQDVALMPTARRYGTSSIWSFSMELDDETGLPAASEFEETNEVDIAASDNELSNCVNDPKECARMPMYFGLAHRSFGTWSPNATHNGGAVGYPYNPATNSTAWTEATWNPYFVPDKVTATDTSGVPAHYVALTSGTSGSSAPAWPATNGDTVCDSPLDLEGKTNCTDPNAAFTETPTLSAEVKSGASTVTVSSSTDIGTGATVSGTGIASGTTVTSVSGTTITLSTATTADIPSGTTLTFVTKKPFGVLWKRLGKQQVEIGTPVWFNVDDEYLDHAALTSTFKFTEDSSTGPYQTYVTSMDTGISGNSPVSNAFMDTSWSTLTNSTAVGVRMGANQRIDFSNLWIHDNADYKNLHTLAYEYVNQADSRCEFVINDVSKSTNQATSNDGTTCDINWLDGAIDTSANSSLHQVSSSTTQINPDVLKSTYNIEGVWGYRVNSQLAFGIFDSGPAILPRLTKAEILAVKNPREAMLVYDTTDHEYVYYNGTNWIVITPGQILQ